MMSVTIHVHEETDDGGTGLTQFCVHDSGEDFDVSWHDTDEAAAVDLAKRILHYSTMSCAVTVRASQQIRKLARSMS